MKAAISVITIILITGLFANSFSDTTVRFRLSPTTGICAPVFSNYPNGNFPNHTDLISLAWTNTQQLAIGRSFFKFNLSSIPSNALVTDARLNLYANIIAYNPLHYWLNGTNESFIRKVVSDWNVNAVTWNNQPAYTTLNQVFLPQSYSTTEDYLNIDVKTYVQEMVQNPNLNYGFMLQLNFEQIYRSMNFASYVCTDTSKRPLLFVTYNLVGIKPVSNKIPERFELYQNYPNPFNPTTSIEFDLPKTTFAKVFVYDVLGRVVQTLVNEELRAGNYKVSFEKNNLSSGIYFYKLVTPEYSLTKKMVIVE